VNFGRFFEKIAPSFGRYFSEKMCPATKISPKGRNIAQSGNTAPRLVFCLTGKGSTLYHSVQGFTEEHNPLDAW
jgi:hypothetical protein